MQQGRRGSATAHPWGRTVGADGDLATDRRTARSAPGLARRASDAPQPPRERRKPRVDELRDQLENFEGQPTPADSRWLRGQLRRLADRLDRPGTGQRREYWDDLTG
jgi:hypothetical protein